MARYRKKPVEIEAIRFTGVNLVEVSKFILDGGGEFTDPDIRGIGIVTLEGTMNAARGDWIIKGVKGEFYPCKPDIFEASYDPVEEAV